MTTTNKPRFVFLDIETSPIIGYTWTTYDANVLKILEPSKTISVAWKELGDPNINVKTIFDYPGYKPGKIDDKKLIKEIWNVLDKADIVCAHHGAAFDIKKLNARFIYHGLSAPSAYTVIDTKKVASKYFKFDSNSLNNLGQYLKEGAKVQNGGFDLWTRCIAGEAKAWELMKTYNAMDVELLERVYLRLRPFIENHPNLNLITGAEGVSCPSCGGTHLQRRGFSFTKTCKCQRYQCSDCKSWSSGGYIKVKNTITK